MGQSFAGRVLIGGSVVLLVIGWAIYAPILTEVSYLNPTPAERELYAFIETLPKDTLIAGTPCTLDNIPLFARRQILLGCEYGNKEETIHQALAAYYAADHQEIIDFCRTHNVDYLVINSGSYSAEYLQQKRLFYEPYNQKLLANIGDRDQFVLAEVPG